MNSRSYKLFLDYPNTFSLSRSWFRRDGVEVQIEKGKLTIACSFDVFVLHRTAKKCAKRTCRILYYWLNLLFCHVLVAVAVAVVALRTFRLGYEYENEYEYDFLLSKQYCSQSPRSSLWLTSRSVGSCRRLAWHMMILRIRNRFKKSYSYSF